MRLSKMFICILAASAIFPVYAKKTVHKSAHKKSVTHAPSISVSEINHFDRYPDNVKKLIKDALFLADQKLTYQFGSADPKNNGMDCSGAISYLLKSSNISKVPRQASELYQWAWQDGEFFAVNSHSLDSFEFSELKPGDLLFWTGTYPVRRDPAVSHVMLYIGRDKNNRPLMFGATERRLANKTTKGVGVFPFNLPSKNSKIRFLGYACIPHLTCS